MIPFIDEIKSELTLFVQNASSHGTKFYDGSKKSLVLSPEVFNLMEFLDELLDNNNLAHRFNYQVHSASITASSQKPNNVGPYRKEDYYLPFLHHLAIQADKVSAENLKVYIQSFLEKNAGLLSVHDTLIMSSGTTRAVANIRFSIDFLRNQRLLENRTIKGKRSLQPTMLGILSLILLKLKLSDSKMDELISLNHDIVFYNSKFYYCYYPWKICKSPEELISSMEKIKVQSSDKEAIVKVNLLIKEYYSFIGGQVNLDTKNGKVKLNPFFQENFLLFINSNAYNWDHTDAIIMLRHAYRRLCGFENEII